ncbi:MAG: hypothetical protein WDO18_11960 [Acidobacteriota bacterium]
MFALEHLVSEAVVVANEVVGQKFAGRNVGEEGVEAQGTAEDGAVIDDTPLAEFGGDVGGRLLDQMRREALFLDAAAAQGGIPFNEFHALVDPADEVAADVEQHADFLVAAVEQSLVEFGAIAVTGRQQSLQHEAGARTFDQLAGPLASANGCRISGGSL